MQAQSAICFLSIFPHFNCPLEWQACGRHGWGHPAVFLFQARGRGMSVTDFPLSFSGSCISHHLQLGPYLTSQSFFCRQPSNIWWQLLYSVVLISPIWEIPLFQLFLMWHSFEWPDSTSCISKDICCNSPLLPTLCLQISLLLLLLYYYIQCSAIMV